MSQMSRTGALSSASNRHLPDNRGTGKSPCTRTRQTCAREKKGTIKKTTKKNTAIPANNKIKE